MIVPRHNSSIGLIWAQANNRVIGLRGAMPWHLPEDLAHFKSTTENAAVIMGRKTWESLPPAFRPLPKRQNIVITRQHNLRAEGAQTAADLRSALKLAAATDSPHSHCWIIGGAQIYALAMPMAHSLVITEIDADFSGDAFAPEINEAEWALTTVSEWQIGRTGLRYRFCRYERQQMQEGDAPQDDA